VALAGGREGVSSWRAWRKSFLRGSASLPTLTLMASGGPLVKGADRMAFSKTLAVASFAVEVSTSMPELAAITRAAAIRDDEPRGRRRNGRCEDAGAHAPAAARRARHVTGLARDGPTTRSGGDGNTAGIKPGMRGPWGSRCSAAGPVAARPRHRRRVTQGRGRRWWRRPRRCPHLRGSNPARRRYSMRTGIFLGCTRGDFGISTRSTPSFSAAVMPAVSRSSVSVKVRW
jgi:hypothetical protein